VTEPELIRWDAPGPYEVVFSTRTGGVSHGAYASLNLGLLSGDERELVHENRARLYEAAGAHPERVSWPRQVHGAAVVRAGTRGEEADAIWTDDAGEPVMVVTADCVPMALVRIGGRPGVALVHVGWRGLLAGVVAAAVDALGGRLVAAAIGPGIGPCCYDVGDEVADPVRAAFGAGLVSERRLDLPGAVERALRNAGCVRVDRLDECTSCHPERYFSHRRDAGLTGRQGAIATIT
jgi:purine-nucleoside/S-methyl-5'-thioadenosine phosphorylase / adenosine deaminase